MAGKAEQEARAREIDRLAGLLKADFSGQAVDVPQLARHYGVPVSSVLAAVGRLPYPRPFRIVRANGVERASEREGTLAWHVMQAALRPGGGNTFADVAARSSQSVARVRETAFRMRDAGLVALPLRDGAYRVEPPGKAPGAR